MYKVVHRTSRHPDPYRWPLAASFCMHFRFIVGASKTPGLLASVHSTVVDELEYDAQSALTHQKRAGEQRQVLWARLQALEAAVEEGIKGAVQGGDGRLQGMLKASVYGLYKLATELSDLVPELQVFPGQPQHT